MTRCVQFDAAADEWDRLVRAADAEGKTVHAFVVAAVRRAVAASQPAALTVRELCERFVAEYTSPRLRDVDAYREDARYRLEHVMASLGARDAETLDAPAIEDFRDDLLARRSAQTVVHSLNRLGRAYRWAKRRGIVRRPDNPCVGIERPERPSPFAPIAPEGYYDADEIRRYLVAAFRAEPSWAVYLATLVLSGLRLSEVAGLDWTDVDLRTARLYVRRRKDGKPQVFPIAPQLAEILARHRERGYTTGLVFPAPSDGERNRRCTVRRAHVRVVRAAGLKYIRPHDLRHSAASAWAEQGVPDRVISRLLGHKTPGMAARYTHLSDRSLRAAVEAVSYDLGGPKPLARAREKRDERRTRSA